MKKHLVPAVVAVTAALGLLACSHDKTKDEGMAAPAASTTTSSAESTTTSSADIAAAETAPSNTTTDTSTQTQDYERSQRK